MEPISRSVFVLAALVLAACAYLAGRASTGRQEEPNPDSNPETRTTGGFAQSPIARTPPATSQASRSIRDAGSYFFARVASQDGPTKGIEGLLLSDRSLDCVEGCPLGLRFRGPPGDRARREAIASSVGPFLDDVEAASAAVPDFTATLRSVRADVGPDASDRAASAARPHRILSLGMPRPDLGDGISEVCLAMYDHCDPHFDRDPKARCDPGGGHILVVRIDRFDASSGRHELVSGVVEVEAKPEAGSGTPHAPVTEAARVVRTIGLVISHFAGVRGTVRGLFLDVDGQLHWYDETLAPRPLPHDPTLLGAVTALLHRA